MLYLAAGDPHALADGDFYHRARRFADGDFAAATAAYDEAVTRYTRRHSPWRRVDMVDLDEQTPVYQWEGSEVTEIGTRPSPERRATFTLGDVRHVVILRWLSDADSSVPPYRVGASDGR